MTRSSTQGKARILLVDDDPIVLESLGGFLELEGYGVQTAASCADARRSLEGGQFNLVITDVNMPAADGFELLRYVKANCPDTVVIMVTAYGTIESAVEAMKEGAYDYLTKPIIDDDVRIAVQRALQQQRLIEENRQLRRALGDRYSFANIVAQDYRMMRVLEVIEAAADSRTTILMSGESGTGKSLIARAIHAHSPRRQQPFVEVSCGALPEGLLESELFGHVRGSFTGALANKEGKFAAADGGTIFLDEISSASANLQVKLLRVLQERCFEPVGSNDTRQVDVRVLLASNCDLAREVREGRFREDLYYRINVVNIDLPPLRERLGDIPLLATHFLEKCLAGSGKTLVGFAPEAMDRMRRYSWPGNVRELANCVERAVLLSRQAYVGVEDLPPAVAGGPAAPPPAGLHDAPAPQNGLPQGVPRALNANGASAAGISTKGKNLQQALDEWEREVLQAALAENQGNRNATARQLGIDRTTLFKKMKKHGLMGS